MLTAGGRAPPFGDLAECATAAGADVASAEPLRQAVIIVTEVGALDQRNWSLSS